MTYGNGVYQHLHTGCFPPTWRCLSPSETQEFSKVANSLGFVLYEPAFYTLYGGYRLPHSNLDLFLGTTRNGVLPGTQKYICAYYAAGRLKMCSTNIFFSVANSFLFYIIQTWKIPVTCNSFLSTHGFINFNVECTQSFQAISFSVSYSYSQIDIFCWK